MATFQSSKRTWRSVSEHRSQSPRELSFFPGEEIIEISPQRFLLSFNDNHNLTASKFQIRDGWALGKNSQTGAQGLFPLNKVKMTNSSPLHHPQPKRPTTSSPPLGLSSSPPTSAHNQRFAPVRQTTQVSSPQNASPVLPRTRKAPPPTIPAKSPSRMLKSQSPLPLGSHPLRASLLREHQRILQEQLHVRVLKQNYEQTVLSIPPPSPLASHSSNRPSDNFLDQSHQQQQLSRELTLDVHPSSEYRTSLQIQEEQLEQHQFLIEQTLSQMQLSPESTSPNGTSTPRSDSPSLTFRRAPPPPPPSSSMLNYRPEIPQHSAKRTFTLDDLPPPPLPSRPRSRTIGAALFQSRSTPGTPNLQTSQRSRSSNANIANAADSSQHSSFSSSCSSDQQLPSTASIRTSGQEFSELTRQQDHARLRTVPPPPPPPPHISKSAAKPIRSKPPPMPDVPQVPKEELRSRTKSHTIVSRSSSRSNLTAGTSNSPRSPKNKSQVDQELNQVLDRITGITDDEFRNQYQRDFEAWRAERRNRSFTPDAPSQIHNQQQQQQQQQQQPNREQGNASKNQGRPKPTTSTTPISAAKAASSGPTSRPGLSLVNPKATQEDPRTTKIMLNLENLKLDNIGSDRVLMTGLMMKQGHRFKTWKTRWFVLFRDELEYYLDQSCRIQRGSVPLTNSRVQDEPHYHRKFLHTFSVSNMGRKTYFVALAYEDKKKWMEMLTFVTDYWRKKHGRK